MRLLIVICFILAISAQRYEQVWSDEFNGNSLDLGKWQYEVDCDGGGNNELQCYTSNSKNLKVSDGHLYITVVPEIRNGKKYSSARINTKGKAAWKYGRFDARAKLPNGIYLWPALWMMPRDNVYGGWAASGEIDIVENHGGQNSDQQSTLHYGGSWPNNIYQGSGPQVLPFDMTTDFHNYSLVWTPDLMQFYVDEQLFHTESLVRDFWSGRGSSPYTAQRQPFDQYFYYIINLAVGGGFFGGNANSLTSDQAANWANPTLAIDFVRVSQLIGSPIVSPIPVPVYNNTQGGCPAGACGGSICCADQSNGPQCYDDKNYDCAVDLYTGLNSLCPEGFSSCNKACYNATLFGCTSTGSLGQPTTETFSRSRQAASTQQSPVATTNAQDPAPDPQDLSLVVGSTAATIVPLVFFILGLIIIF